MLIDPHCIDKLHTAGIRNDTPAVALERQSDNSSGCAPPLPNTFVTQGLVDLQINGFAGVDYNNPASTAEEIHASLQAMLATGVTRCLPTVITADLQWQSDCFAALEAARAASPLASTMMAGYHLEGPFMSPEPGYSGCHPAADMRAGDIDYFERVQAAANGHIKLVTVAPERPGVLSLIPQLVSRGVTVAIGHSAADHDTVQRAVDAGSTLSTHLGNGVASPLPKGDNIILSQLASDALTASFIADGVHIRQHVLGVYLRAKTSQRTILVTDGTAGSAARPGQYTLGKIAIERQQDPIVYIPGTTGLAGSATTLDACVRNVVTWFEVPMQEALSWAAVRPRTAIGLSAEPAAGDEVEWVFWRTDSKGPQVSRVMLGTTVIDFA